MAEADSSSPTKWEITEDDDESVFSQGDELADENECICSQTDDLIEEDESVSSQRDIEFCELYFKVIDKQLSRGDYEENIQQAEHHFAEIRSRANKWCRFKKKNDLEQVNLLKHSFYYRMLCIYCNATCISSAVAYHFGNFLNQNSKLLKKLLKKNVLRICSIGGGLPSDVVAFIKVVESSIYIKEDVHIHITVVDVDKKWKKPCTAILHTMDNFNKEKWKIDFITLDLSSQSISPKVASAIKEADFVSLLKFLNQLEDQDTEFKRHLFQNMHHLVSPGSVLFLMDHAAIEVMKVFQGYLGRLHGHKLLYEVACHLHTLQLTTVKRHYELYHKHLIGSGMCNTSFKLFCRAWIRTSETFLHTGNHLESFDPRIKKAEKSLEEKRAWQGQLRLLCRQLSNNKISKDMVSWRDCFVIEMENQGCSKKRIQRTLNAAEKDLVLRRIYAKQLMFASYQDFLEEAHEICDARKESDEALKDEKRKDFYEKERRANFEWKTYEICIKRLLRRLEQRRCTKATQTEAVWQD
ncbi:hypothetical protein AVEN_210951-1 [Araneus ventricosus]|uniref:Methyltransferase domain-containing protein n=1 Tax=Araneus ventricosus TaxID=182803 RepID=A0A4Y2DHJ0_ARAVE|nr:hypothetical protein AVEN_210951-1 [Araneus ventricosus]